MKQETSNRQAGGEFASATGSALIGECDTCGNITAIDLNDTPEHWKEMQYPGRTVKRMPKDEALALWRERGKRCGHKALIAELRARVAPNEPSAGTAD